MRSGGLLACAIAVSAACSDAPPPRTEADASGAPPADAAPVPPEPLDWRAQVIYLAMPDRFHNGDPGNDRVDCDGVTRFHGGDLAGLRDRLDYLEALGVTTLWINPVYAQVGCGYHGYWPDFRVPDDGAMEPAFGTPEDLLALIDDLHDRGLLFMMDMVVNHAGRNATVVGQRPSWFHAADGCAELGPSEVFCPLSGLPDFAHERDDVAAYVTGMSERWLTRFPVDGIRMDTAKHVAYDYFRDEWVPRVRALPPRKFLVGEIFNDDWAEWYPGLLDTGFDSFFHFPLRRALIDSFARGGSTNAVAQRVRETIDRFGHGRALMITTFLDNHDVRRYSQEALDVAAPDEARRRYWLALTALFTLPGIPQLYYGDELGFYGDNAHNRPDMPGWAWTAADRAGDHDLTLPRAADTYDLVVRLITARRANPALYKGSYWEMWRENAGPHNALAYFRGDGDNRIVVALNNEPHDIELPLRIAHHATLPQPDKDAMPDGTVLDDLAQLGAPATATVEAGELRLTLPAKTAAIYRVR